MKQELESINQKFIVDPSINLENEFIDLLQDLRIKILSYQDNQMVLQNLFKLMLKYLDKKLCKDILERSIEKEKIRELYLNQVLDLD